MKSRLRVLILLAVGALALGIAGASAQNADGQTVLASATALQPVDGQAVLLYGTATESEPDSGEPFASCADPSAIATAWFSWTPEVSGAVDLDSRDFGRSIALFSAAGTDPGYGDLTEIGCVQGFTGQRRVRINAGETYLVQVRQAPGPIEGGWDVRLAPANDDFANARVLGPVTGSTVAFTGDTSLALAEPGEPTPSCEAFSNTVWFSWTPEFTGEATLRVPSNSSVASVFTSSADAPSIRDLDEVGCVRGFGSRSLTFAVENGSTYWISRAGGGSGLLTLEKVPDPPANDDLADATVVAAQPGTRVLIEGPGAGASMEEDEQQPACSGWSRTAWFSWTPTESGPVAMEVGGGTVVAVYRSDAESPKHADLELIDCVDFGEASFDVTAGETYWLQVQSSISAFATITPVARPANDDFENAAALVLTDGRTLVASGSVRYATTQFGEPTGCAANGNTIWFEWTSQFSGSVSVAPLLAGRLAVFQATGGSPAQLANLTEVRCGEGSFSAASGTTYWLRLSGSDNAAARIRPHGATLVANDNLADAWAVEPGDGARVTLSETFALMTTEVDEPVPSCFGPTASTATRWYSWTPDFTGPAELSTSFGRAAVYATASVPATFADLTEVVCGFGSFDVEAGETYFVQASATPFGGVIGNRIGFVASIGRSDPPPANDDIAGAVDLGTVSSAVAFSGNAGSATLGENEPLGDDVCGSGFAGTPVVWYRMSPEVSGLLSVSPSASSARIVVYTSELDPPGYSDLSAVGCGGAGRAVEVEAGRSYWIGVAARTDFDAVVRFVERPANDDLANAQVVETPDGGPVTFEARPIFGTTEADEAEPSCGYASTRTVWFRWTPQSDGWADLTGASNVASVAVFVGDSAPASHNSLVEVGCRRSFTAGFVFEAGSTYYIAVAGGASRQFELNPYPAPTNDDLSGAVVESVVDGAPFLIDGSTFASSLEPSEVEGLCGTADELGSVWARWSPEFGEVIDVDGTFASRVSVSVYSSASTAPAFGALSPVGCVGVDGLQFVASAGTTYWFRIAGSSGPSGDPFEITVRPTTLLDGWGAETIRSLPARVAGFSGTVEPDEPTPSCAATVASSAWFMWTADQSGEMVLDPTGSSAGVGIALYTGPGRSDGIGLADGLTEVVCIEAPVDRVVEVEAGVTYWVQLTAPSNPADFVIDIRPVSAEGDRPEPGPFGPIEVPSAGGELSFNASGASYELTEGPTVCGPTSFANSVWLRWKPQSSELFELLANGAVEVTIDGGKPTCVQGMLDASAGDTFLFRFDAPPGDARTSRFTLSPFCDDDNPLTADSFNADTEACEHVLIDGAACDDGNAATEGDVVVDGECVGEPISCDDGDPFTEDIADPAVGCVHVQGDRPPTIVAPADLIVGWEEALAGFDLGSPVVSDDSGREPQVSNDAPVQFGLGETLVTWTAVDGSGNASFAVQLVRVLPPLPGFCDDGDPLTLDSFDAESAECVTEPVPDGTACDDGNLATEGDVVVDGECVGEPIICDDGDPFTADVADPTLGCVHIEGERPPTVRGRVWHDADYDNLRDPGEGTHRFVTVTLRTADGDVESKPVNPDGTYEFVGIEPFVSYSVRFSTGGLWYFVDANVGDDESIDSDVRPFGSGRQSAGLNLGVLRPNAVLTIDAGLTRSLSVQATVFHDLDRDGRRDAGEGPFPTDEVTVEVVDESGDVVARMAERDSAGGLYRFDLLQPGTYTMRMITWSNRRITTPNQLASTVGSRPFVTSTSAPFTLGNDRLGIFFTVGLAVDEFSLELLAPIDGLGMAEGGGPSVVLPLAIGTALDDVELVIEVGDETEFITEQRLLVLAPADRAFLRITALDDDLVDGDIAVPITISAFGGGYTGQSVTFVLVNLDDDEAGVLVKPVSGLETTEGGATATFEVVLDNAPTRDVTIPLSVSDPSEGTIDAAELVFTRDNWNRPQTVTVAGVDDDLDDGDIDFVVRLGVVTGDVGAWIGLDPPDVAVTNLDDDESTVSGVVWYDDGDGVREPGEPAYPQALMQLVDSDGTTVASVTTTDGTYRFVAPAPGIYTVRADFLWQFFSLFDEDPTIANAGNDDTIDSDFEATDFADAESAPFELGPGLVVTNVDAGVIRLVRGAAVTVSPVSGLNTDESGTSATFTVVLERAPVGNVTIPVSVSDTTEASTSTDELVFTTDDWDDPQTVTVTGVDDTFLDGDRPFTVILGPAAGGGYAGVDPVDPAGTNADDDTNADEVAPELTPPADITVEASGPLTSVALGSPTVVDDQDPSPTVTNDSPGLFPLGTTIVTWKATDEAGNLSSVTQSVEVVDTTGPGITAPADVTVDEGQPVVLGSASVDDLVDPNPTITNDAPTVFPLGTTTVTWKATDASGNISTARQTVDVLAPAGISYEVVGDPVVGEDGTFVDIRITLDRPQTGVLVIPVSVSDPTEAVSNTTYIVWDFPWTIVRGIRVTGVDDPDDDGDVAFQLQIGPPSGGGYDGVPAIVIDLTNIDDDDTPPPGDTTPPQIIAPEDVLVLRGQPIVLGTPTVSDDVDPSPAVTNNAPVTFPVGLTTVTWTATDAAGNSATATQDVVVVVPSVTVSPTSGLTTSEAGTDATFTVVLDAEPTGEVTINVVSLDSTEGRVGVIGVDLTFDVDNWDEPQTVLIDGVDDIVDDGDVAYTVRVGTATGGGYDGVDPADVAVTNIDDDEASATIAGRVWDDLDADGLQDAGEPGLNNVTVRLLNGANFVLDTTQTDSDGSYSFGGLVPGALYKVEVPLNGPRYMTQSDVGNDDTIDSDFDEELGITDDLVLSSGEILGSVDAGLHLERRILVDPEFDLTTTEAGGQATLTVALNSEPTGTVTVEVASTDTSEGTVDVAQLTFGIDDWDEPQTVTVTGVDDELDDGDVFYWITVGPASGGGFDAVDTREVFVNNIDDDEPVTTGTVFGVYWLDEDYDGLRDAGEPRVAGARVRLYPQGSVVPIEDTNTNVGGGYELIDIPAGTYRVRFSVSLDQRFAPADVGEDDSIDSDVLDGDEFTDYFTVGAGQDVAIDAGSSYRISVFGRVWNDAGADGLQEFTPESRAAGVTVELLDGADDVLASQPTGSTGNYLFDGLVPGQYRVRVVLPTGASFSSGPDVDIDTGTGRSSLASLSGAAGNRRLEADAGLVYLPNDVTPPDITAPADVSVLQGQPVVLGSPTVSDDVDPSPVVTNDAPGTFPLGVTTVTWTATDEAGNSATDTQLVTVGAPSVTVSPTSGLETSEAGIDATFTVVLDVRPTGDVTINVKSSDTSEGRVGANFSAGVDLVFGVDDWDVPQTVTVEGVRDTDVQDVVYTVVLSPATGGGYDGVDPPDVTVTNLNIDEATGVLTGRVWNDLDGDGIEDPGEPGLSGVRLDLGNGLGFGLGTEISGVDGVYEFTGLVSAVFKVRVTVPDGFSLSPAGVGGDESVDSDFVAFASTDFVTVTQGQTTGDIDAGLTPDPTPGVTVSPISGLVTTEAGGTASFSVVLDAEPSGVVTIGVSSSDPGEGTVNVGQLQFGVGDWDTPQIVTVTGVDDADDDGDVGYSIVLGVASGGGYGGIDPADVTATNIDDDEVVAPTGSISGHSWLDLDFSDSRSAGDIPANDLTVRLLDSTLTEIASTTTSAAGTYSFGGLAPGTYYIRFDPNPGFWPVAEDSAPDDVDSDIFFVDRTTEAIVLGEGEVVPNVDAGWSGDF